jgi:hypothetical protein
LKAAVANTAKHGRAGGRLGAAPPRAAMERGLLAGSTLRHSELTFQNTNRGDNLDETSGYQETGNEGYAG